MLLLLLNCLLNLLSQYTVAADDFGDLPVINFPKYPCHTQAVERCVKLVPEAASLVCGHNAEKETGVYASVWNPVK